MKFGDHEHATLLLRFALVIIIVVIMLGVVGFLAIMRNATQINNECLEEIAGKYCEDKDMFLEGIHKKHFDCRDERVYLRSGLKQYKFLDEEIRGCEE